MNNIPMPPRNTISEIVARAGAKCLFLACKKQFPLVAIGEVASVVSGGTPSTRNPTYWEGDIVWVTPKDLGRPRNIEIDDSERKITQEGLDRSSARLLPVGTILLSSRAPIGHLGITAVPLATNQGFKNITCNEQLNNRFLFHMLRASIEELQAAGRGNTFTEIPARIVKEFEIPFPPLNVQKVVATFLDTLYWRLNGKKSEFLPLPECISEQQRIVAKIEQLAAKVEEAKNLNESALKQTESILWTAKNKVFNRDSSSEWSMMRLEEVAPVNMGQSPPGHSYNSEGEGIPLLNDPTEFGKEHPKEVQWTTEPTKFCKARDLLICVRGATTGRTNWADKIYCIGRGLAALTVDQNICLPKYVYHFITFSTQKLLALSAGSTFPNLPGAKLKALRIPCPSLEEQCRIVAYLDNLQAKVDSLKQLKVQTQTELDALLPSILDKAFKGEL